MRISATVTKGLPLLFILQCIFVLVSGHSWLDCINVANPNQITTLANMDCNGFPANYVGRANPDANMYKVEGIAQSAWPSTPCCKTTSRTYSAQYPMYVVQAGGTMTLGYTPNGHVNWMAPPPPYGSQNWTIYWTPNNPGQTSMVTLNDMISATPMARVLFETPCHDRNTGAQLDPSAGLCAGAVTIPANTRPGVYQMVWYWPFRFQGPSIIEDYMTCFDVQVTGGAQPTISPTTTTTRPPITTTTTTPTIDPPYTTTTTTPTPTTIRPSTTTPTTQTAVPPTSAPTSAAPSTGGPTAAPTTAPDSTTGRPTAVPTTVSPSPTTGVPTAPATLPGLASSMAPPLLLSVMLVIGAILIL